jgi:hypothetical protein
MTIAFDVAKHAVIVTFFVFVMMMIVDYFNVMTRGRLSTIAQGGQWRQYIAASTLGVIPGCLGAFLNVSFYVHGLFSIGAITAGMIATSGDEAFIMLAMFPDKALLLFGILFTLGLVSGWIMDKLANLFKIVPCEACRSHKFHTHELESCRCYAKEKILSQLKSISLPRLLIISFLLILTTGVVTGILGPPDWNWQRITIIMLLPLALFIVVTTPEHYLREHIWDHIVKGHLWRVFLWTFGALLVMELGFKYWDLESFISDNMLWVLILACVIALIPESGPHLIFVTMFAGGLIPFSVLLASSIVQDGHGMLPLLSYTLKDTVIIKAFNLVIGLGLGLFLYAMGW